MVERNAVHPTTIKKSRCTDQNLFSKKLSCRKSLGIYTVWASLYPATEYFNGWSKGCQAFLNYLSFKQSYFKTLEGDQVGIR